MSKAYLPHKNFTFKEMMNLLSYGTKHPETLSHVQKITRLYRSSLRRVHAMNLEGYRTDHTEFQRNINIVSNDFYKMMDLPAQSNDLKTLLEKYESWQAEYYDPNMVLDECRPYTSTSSRYPIWNNDALSFDPFGFYSKKRLTAEKYPEENFPYYEAYPMVETHWTMPEIFDSKFDDTNYEKLDAEERIAKAENIKSRTGNKE